MKHFFDKIRGNAFESQDSKYFIFTAFKVLLVPIIAFSVIYFSLWNVMDMNFNFFVANGFSRGDLFKDAFYDKIALNVITYFAYIAFALVGVFISGLLIAHLALRPFNDIKNFAEFAEEDPNYEFEVEGLNKQKTIFQVASIFFQYVNSKRMNLESELHIPSHIQKMKKPKTDKVFLVQYFSIVSIMLICLGGLLNAFTTDLYNEISTAGIELLKGNSVVASFLQSQKYIFDNIFYSTMTLVTCMYIMISKNIIKSVDGVSYAFCRDLLQVVKGNHSKRIFPRYTDPGKDAANALNEYMDFSLMIETKDESFEQDKVLNFKPKDKDLPPSFIEEKQVAGSDIVYNITTPTGYKVENLSESQILKVLREVETPSDE